jgi:hypothetical protein
VASGGISSRFFRYHRPARLRRAMLREDAIRIGVTRAAARLRGVDVRTLTARPLDGVDEIWCAG